MIINRENILEVCRKSNIRPDKDYGQNFLIGPNVSENIVNALDILEGDSVLEIGPGLGSLTHFLSEKSKNLTVIDIDYNMTAFLNVVYQNSGVNIVNEDVRKHDVSNYTKIIANLPYNITSELIVYLLTNATKAQKLVLMCQLEAFSHFYDVEGSEYGPSSILVHLLGNIKKLFVVKKGSFYPVPKINSVVFEINLNGNSDLTSAIGTYKLARQLFNNRRKTVLNNLNNYLKDKTAAEEALTKLNIPFNYRPEQISPAQMLALYQLLNH